MGPHDAPHDNSKYSIKIESHANFVTKLLNLVLTFAIGHWLRQILILAGSLALMLWISKVCLKNFKCNKNVIEKISTVLE